MSAPDTLDLTAGAELVVVLTLTSGEGSAIASTAAMVWAALVGMPMPEALVYAQELVTFGPPTTASIAPF